MSYMPINGAKTWAKLVYRSSDTRKLRTAVAKRFFVKKKPRNARHVPDDGRKERKKVYELGRLL